MPASAPSRATGSRPHDGGRTPRRRQRHLGASTARRLAQWRLRRGEARTARRRRCSTNFEPIVPQGTVPFESITESNTSRCRVTFDGSTSAQSAFPTTPRDSACGAQRVAEATDGCVERTSPIGAENAGKGNQTCGAVQPFARRATKRFGSRSVLESLRGLVRLTSHIGGSERFGPSIDRRVAVSRQRFRRPDPRRKIRDRTRSGESLQVRKIAVTQILPRDSGEQHHEHAPGARERRIRTRRAGKEHGRDQTSDDRDDKHDSPGRGASHAAAPAAGLASCHGRTGATRRMTGA